MICACCGKPKRPAGLEGLGTALKPAMELICLARKPLSGTVAENVLAHGTGGLNVDGCRVPHNEVCRPMAAQENVNSIIGQSGRYEETLELKPNGRWPANVIHDGSAEVEEAFATFGERGGNAPASGATLRGGNTSVARGKFNGLAAERESAFYSDTGIASRFFYTAKADAEDRLGSKHPTVKPLDLMQYLVRLITPPGGTVLDLFAGTGTTGEAAFREGMRAILIEREAEYLADIERRMGLAYASNKDRKATSDRVRNKVRVDRYPDTGSLF